MVYMESKALALGKQVKAEALNSNAHQNDLYGVQSFRKASKS